MNKHTNISSTNQGMVCATIFWDFVNSWDGGTIIHPNPIKLPIFLYRYVNNTFPRRRLKLLKPKAFVLLP